MRTPQKLTDGAGQVVWSASYRPFGEASIQVGYVTQNLRFPGQYCDEESGLHYNYFRTYDPSIGRYLTADPLGVTPFGSDTSGGLNHLYAYANNNPVRFTDPLGLIPCTCRATGGGSRPPGGGVKTCTYRCTCTDDCGRKKTFEYKYPAGSGSSARCINQQDPHYTQPGNRSPDFHPFDFDTDSPLDRLNPFRPSNDFMDGVERQFGQ